MTKPPYTARLDKRRYGIFIALCSLADAIIGLATLGRRLGLCRQYGSLLIARERMAKD